MTSIPGVDYAWSHPSPTALRIAGKKFACRYLSGDATKNLSLAESKALAEQSISSVVVWETTARRALDGHAAGAADAARASTLAAGCGMPGSRPVYFAVDFDATEAQQTAINAYLDGAASVIGRARTGVYGGYYPVKRALDAGKVSWAWQTVAWSGGQWDSRAVIRQGAQATIGGVSVDLNTALADDYGQWTPGEDPSMALSDDDKTWIKAAIAANNDEVARAVLHTDGLITAPVDAPDAATNPYWRLDSYVKATYALAESCVSILQALDLDHIAEEVQAKITALKGSITFEP